MKPPRLEAHGVFERLAVIPHDSGAWFAVFQFYYDGLDYDTYFAVGSSELTERQAVDVVTARRMQDAARKQFLETVVLRMKH